VSERLVLFVSSSTESSGKPIKSTNPCGRLCSVLILNLTFLLWKTLPCSINRADGAFFRVLFAEAVLLKSGVRKPPFERNRKTEESVQDISFYGVKWSNILNDSN